MIHVEVIVATWTLQRHLPVLVYVAGEYNIVSISNQIGNQLTDAGLHFDWNRRGDWIITPSYPQFVGLRAYAMSIEDAAAYAAKVDA